MTTSQTEKQLLQRSACRRFLIGLALFILPILIAAPLAMAYPAHASPFMLGALVARILGVAAWGLCLADLAESKGHSRTYGFLVLLGFIGLLWAVLLRDKNTGDGPVVRSYAW